MAKPAKPKCLALSPEDFSVFCALYPSLGTDVADRLSVSRSAQALRSIAFRHGIKADNRSQRHTKHGYVGTRTYKAWFSAKQRCTNPNNQAYPKYGGAGVKFFAGWNKFLAFLADVGSAPSDKHQIDRIDSSRGYMPGNVRWATPSQNAANTRSQNKTGFRGVDLLPSGRYRASICVSGKKVSLGVFDTGSEAADAYDQKAVELFGEFAVTNDMAWTVPNAQQEGCV